MQWNIDAVKCLTQTHLHNLFRQSISYFKGCKDLMPF